MRLFRELILLSFIAHMHCLLTMAPIVSDDMDAYMNFIYINEKSFSYNEAIEVCARLNATLMTMRSWNKLTLIQQLFYSTEDWNSIPSEEAWIGLTHTIYGLNWIDCAPLDVNELSLFKDPADADFKASEQCYRVKEGEGFRWKQKKCGDDLAAICEQRIHGLTCIPQTLLKVDFLDSSENDESTCTTNCGSEENCFAMVHYKNGSDNTCIHMKRSSSDESLVTLKIKQCIKGEVKYASDITLLTDNNDATPSWSCSNSLALSVHTTVSTSISTVIVSVTPSVPVIEYTSCFNITVTETLQNNFTTYIPQPTSVIHSLLITTTTTMVPTTVVLTTVLAPSTVTVEVTPSVAACQDTTTYINITNTKYIEEAVENITKALYVDKKTMSSYVRSKTCAEDDRTSSATVGYFGIVLIVVPFALIFLLDLRTIFVQIKETAQNCQSRPKCTAKQAQKCH